MFHLVVSFIHLIFMGGSFPFFSLGQTNTYLAPLQIDSHWDQWGFAYCRSVPGTFSAHAGSPCRWLHGLCGVEQERCLSRNDWCRKARRCARSLHSSFATLSPNHLAVTNLHTVGFHCHGASSISDAQRFEQLRPMICCSSWSTVLLHPCTLRIPLVFKTLALPQDRASGRPMCRTQRGQRFNNLE